MPKPEIIYGADRRTRSNVWFGDPDLGDRYYDTTMEEQYQPQKMPDKLTAQHNNTKSCVPVNYYRKCEVLQNYKFYKNNVWLLSI